MPICCVLLLAWLLPTEPDALRFEDLLAGVRQHRGTINTARVTWQRKHEYTPPFREYHREMANVLNRELQGGRLTKEVKAQLTLSFEQSQKMSAYDPVTWLDQDFWTDGANYQVRLFPEPGSPGVIFRTGAGFKPLVFPNEETKPDNLKFTTCLISTIAESAWRAQGEPRRLVSLFPASL